MYGRHLANGLLVLAAGTALAACASSSPTGRGSDLQTPAAKSSGASTGISNDAPVRVTPSRKPVTFAPAGECGTVPVSSGPLAQLARLTFEAPATAAAGDTVSVSVTISSTAEVPRVITTPGRSALLVVQNGRVVGRALGVAAPEVPLQLNASVASPAQAVPKALRLESCGSGSSNRALAGGHYTLVAVLGYRIDQLNAAPNDGDTPPQAGGQPFVLVSAPAPITVG